MEPTKLVQTDNGLELTVALARDKNNLYCGPHASLESTTTAESVHVHCGCGVVQYVIILVYKTRPDTYIRIKNKFKILLV